MGGKRRRITLKGTKALKQLEIRLRNLPPEMDGAVIRGLQSATMRGVSAVVEKIDQTSPYPPVNNGSLRQSVGFGMLPRGAKLHVDVPHAAPMEFGTRPFTPPLGPLYQWAMDKGIAENEAHARGIAMAIREKFEDEGIAPRFYFRRAMTVVKAKYIPQEVDKELGNIG